MVIQDFDYDPRLGRFYATDPKAQFASPYLYTGNNPINLVDPDGEFAFLTALLIGTIVGAVIGGASYGIDKAIKGEKFQWDEFGIAVGVGAVAGAVGFAAGAVAASGATALGAGVIVEGIVAGAVGGGAGSAAGQLTNNLATGKEWNENLGEATLFGAVAGAALGGTIGAYSRYTGKLRMGYVQETQNLRQLNQELQARGVSPFRRALFLARERRTIGMSYKQKTPSPIRQIIFQRNMRTYGDQWGPTWRWLLQRNAARGRTWNAAFDYIANSASRTSRFWTAIAPERNWTALLAGSQFPIRERSQFFSF